MVSEPCTRCSFQVVHREFVTGLASQMAVERAFAMFGEVVQTQSPLSHLLVLEKGATSTIDRADRGEAGRRNSEFNAQMSQHTRRDHLNQIERCPCEAQETDLQRHTQPVQRPASAVDSSPFVLGKREEMRDF